MIGILKLYDSNTDVTKLSETIKGARSPEIPAGRIFQSLGTCVYPAAALRHGCLHS